MTKYYIFSNKCPSLINVPPPKLQTSTVEKLPNTCTIKLGFKPPKSTAKILSQKCHL